MSTLITLLFHLVKEYIGLESESESDPKDKRNQYLVLAFIMVFSMMSVALVLVTFRAVSNAEELIRYKKEVTGQLEQCSLKNHQDDSFDRGNGLDPKMINGFTLDKSMPCQDYWCK